MSVIPFARSTRAPEPATANPGRLRETSGEDGRATDIEAAVREAIAALPAGLVPRVALISDGKENKGSIVRAAYQAQQLGIPIDTFALAGRPKPALHLDSISLPSNAFTGEQFPIDLVVSTPNPGPAEIELAAEGRRSGQVRGSAPSRRQSGQHACQPQYARLARSLHRHPLPAAGEVRFEQAVTLRRPKVLYHFRRRRRTRTRI